MKFQQWGFACGLAVWCCATAASAQGAVLERIRDGGKLVIAYRESSVPFSYVNSQTGKPIGYALDLCLLVFILHIGGTALATAGGRSAAPPSA